MPYYHFAPFLPSVFYTTPRDHTTEDTQAFLPQPAQPAPNSTLAFALIQASPSPSKASLLSSSSRLNNCSNTACARTYQAPPQRRLPQALSLADLQLPSCQIAAMSLPAAVVSPKMITAMTMLGKTTHSQKRNQHQPDHHAPAPLGPQSASKAPSAPTVRTPFRHSPSTALLQTARA
jgi:hypothetical protein